MKKGTKKHIPRYNGDEQEKYIISPSKLKKFRITEQYSDLCYFRKIIEIEAKDEDEAQELYEEGEVDYSTIMDEIFDQDNDPQWREIEEVEEISVPRERGDEPRGP